MAWSFYTSTGQQTSFAQIPAVVSIPFSSGTSLTISSLSTNTFTQCSTTAGTSYTVTIPTSTGSLYIMTFADEGTVATGNITFSPSSGSIKGMNVLNIVGSAISFQDGPLGWSSI